MRRLISAVVLGGAVFVLGTSPAAASMQKQRACSAKDNAGNWEVMIGHASTAKAARAIVSRATAKGLRATVERDGCAKRYEAVITASSQASANSMKAKARKDGFKTASVEKS